jgi:hypothetical protein
MPDKPCPHYHTPHPSGFSRPLTGHGIVFSATEVPRGTKRLPERRGLTDYVREHLEADRA